MNARTLLSIVLTIVPLVACSAPASGPGSPLAGTFAPANAVRPAAFTITGTYTTGISNNAATEGINPGPDGRIWFTEFNASKVGAITTSGTVTEYPTVAGGQPNPMIWGPSHQSLWTGGYGGQVIVVAPNGTQKTYPVAGAHINDLVVGPDKNVWFVDYGNNKIGRMTGQGVFTEFSLGAKSSPSAIVSSGGNLWVADQGLFKIVKVSTAGAVLGKYGTFTPGEYLEFMIVVPNGTMYVTEYADSNTIPDKIARVTPAGVVKEIGSLPSHTYPNRLCLGKDGNVYFANYTRKSLGIIKTATGVVTLTPLPLANDHGTDACTNGPDGRLWMTGFQTIYAISY